MAHDRGRLSGGAAVGIGHDGGNLFVAHQDGFDAVLLGLQDLEDLPGPAPGDAEDVLDTRFLQSLDNHLAG